MNKKPNIFLITIDCLRSDYLGCLGNKENLTSNIDQCANNGILFSQTIVNGPSTPFSFPSIFTSTYPLIDPNFPRLSRFRLTLPKFLKNSGFKTAGFNSNPYLSKYYNYDIGYTHFNDILSRKNKKVQKRAISFIKKHNKLNSIIKRVYKKIRLNKKKKVPYEKAEVLNKRALNWVKNNQECIFVWIHYMDTHHPFLPPKEYRNISARKMYRAERTLKRIPPRMSEKELLTIKNLYKGTIKHVDDEIGNLFKGLKKLNMFDNALIIITSDHGEEFFDHGGVSHICKLYEELLHVPLIIKGPGLLKHFKVDKLVTLMDLAPTIVDYLGFEKIDDFLGKSFLPLLSTNAEQPYRESVISEALTKNGKITLSYKDGYRVTSYRTEEWKLIINNETKSKELYNLKEDLNEKKNLYKDYEDIVKEFEEKINDHIKMEEILQKNFKERQKLRDIAKRISL